MADGQAKQNEKIVMRVSFYSMATNIALSIFKVLAGFLAHSGAMVSDGIHSASDVFSTVVVMVGYRLAGKESDENHQYGHERIECVAAILLSMILCITGFAIGLAGFRKIIGQESISLEAPGLLALAAAVLSILVKEAMYWYTRGAAKKVNSAALMADAWHHRSDSLSSIGSMAGIIGARLGYPVCDPIASVIICVFIVKAAYEIFKDAVDKMMDTACDTEMLENIRHVITAQEGVLGIDRLQTRLFGELPLREAHVIAERVHNAIENSFEEVKHCMVHVNPKD